MGYTLKFIKITNNMELELRFIATEKIPYSIATWYRGEVKSELPIKAENNEQALQIFENYIESKFN
jgi:hypothetical protein